MFLRIFGSKINSWNLYELSFTKLKKDKPLQYYIKRRTPNMYKSNLISQKIVTILQGGSYEFLQC